MFNQKKSTSREYEFVSNISQSKLPIVKKRSNQINLNNDQEDPQAMDNQQDLNEEELQQRKEYEEYLLQHSKEETNPFMKDISPEECDEFQKKLDSKYIQRIWKSFRESGNSENGKISRSVFKKVFLNIIDDTVREIFLDALFERFRLEKISEKYDEAAFASIGFQNESEQIDIQDLVISLTILARMSEEQKLKLIFTLTDVDEDECLSTEDIRKMIQRIEKNFTTEQSHISSDSSCLAHEFALNKSQRRFEWTIYNLGIKEQTKENNNNTNGNSNTGGNNLNSTGVGGNSNSQTSGNPSGSASSTNLMNGSLNNRTDGDKDENKLITWEEFIECLNKKQSLKKRFLPNNYLLFHCLKNTNREREYKINTDSAGDFDVFRKLIHMKLRNFYDKDYTQAYAIKEKGIRYPGKIKLDPAPEKKPDLLPNYQKATDKKKLNTLIKDFKSTTSNLQKNFIEEQLKKMESQEDSFTKQFGSKPENSNNLKKFVEILEKIRAMKDDPIHVKFDESNPTAKKR